MTYLKAFNPWYSDIELVTGNIPKYLSSLGHFENIDSDSDIDFDIIENQKEEHEDPMSENRLSCSETALVSNTVEDELSISPCEGKTPLSIYDDEFCEELAYPFLFISNRQTWLQS